VNYSVTFWTDGKRGVVYPAESLSESLRRLATLVENYEQEGARTKLDGPLAVEMGRFGKHTLEPSM
jgi:hypothetical protein